MNSFDRNRLDKNRVKSYDITQEEKAMNLKEIYNRYQRILKPLLLVKNRLFALRCRTRGQNNQILGLDGCRMKKCAIDISGSNNMIEIGELSTLENVTVSIHGSHNHVVLGRRNYLSGCAFCVEDDGNRIETGEHTYIYGGSELSAIEGTTLRVGADCLFSADVTVRTGDSHAIWDSQGCRANPSADIEIEEHVWAAKDVKILKGARIPAGCIVGTGAVVMAGTKAQPESVLAGLPARQVKTGIRWTQQRKTPPISQFNCQ